MEIYFCEIKIPASYETLFDLTDDEQMSSYEDWVGKCMAAAFLEKYGEIGKRILGGGYAESVGGQLVRDCDFHGQPDGSVIVKYSTDIHLDSLPLIATPEQSYQMWAEYVYGLWPLVP